MPRRSKQGALASNHHPASKWKRLIFSWSCALGCGALDERILLESPLFAGKTVVRFKLAILRGYTLTYRVEFTFKLGSVHQFG